MKKITTGLKSFFCLLFGHKPTTMLVEDEDCIFTCGCSFCGCGVGMPAMWKGIAKLPPPGYNEEQKKEWHLYIEKRMQDLRDSVL